MHEATLAARMLRIACEAAEGRPGRVTGVTVVVGELAGILPDALAFAFDTLKRDTRLNGARLNIVRQPVRARCRDCGATYDPPGFPFACPQCGSSGFQIIQGEDFYVKELELRHEQD